MIIREARTKEIRPLLEAGYKIWHKGRSFEEYYRDNSREDAYGTRYVLEAEGEIASSLIVLRLGERFGCKAYGFGSVLTEEVHKGKGYAAGLLDFCIKKLRGEDCIIFLYSEIAPAFYERFHFRILPDSLQKKKGCYCMALCKEETWKKILTADSLDIPDYF